MRGAVERGHLVLGIGDFNMLPLSFAHQLIITHGMVHDAWRVIHPDSSIGAAEDEVERCRGREMPNAGFNLTKNGTTCDSILNTWRWNERQQKQLIKGKVIDIQESASDPRGKRLDYIFFGFGKSPRSSSERFWKVQDIKVGMTRRHPILHCSLSDHFSVEATLANSQHSMDPSTEQSTETIPRTSYLPVQTYNTILTMISKYELRERKQRRYRLCHFITSIFAFIGCSIAIWWSPQNYVSFILMLFSTLGLSSGIIDGLIGGLFVGSEIRALKEFEWEISNAKQFALEE
jgi:sphingomyelin phosphodiesterase 2